MTRNGHQIIQRTDLGTDTRLVLLYANRNLHLHVHVIYVGRPRTNAPTQDGASPADPHVYANVPYGTIATALGQPKGLGPAKENLRTVL